MITDVIPKRICQISLGKLSSNCYLLNYADKKILIDSCEYKSRQQLIDSFRQLKIKPESVDTVLLTHLHFDHSGNAALFKNAKIYAGDAEIKSFGKNPEKTISADYMIEQKKLVEELKSIEFKLLSDLEIPGIEFIKVPGHTQGSYAFYLPQKKILFSGDTLFSRNKDDIGRIDMLTSAPEKMPKSVEALLKLDFRIICPGHGYSIKYC